ncbi:MAG: ABC transporter permease [Chloroflexota bacterium]|nr:ABC transporter permease [Chloroflexota bacterium]
MTDITSLAFLTAVLAAAIPAGTAILYACLGELLCERAGVLNLGVEGMMLMGALGGFAVTFWTGNVWLGALAALALGGLLASIHALLVVGLHANQVVSGLALTLFGAGLSSFLGQDLVGQPAPTAFRDWAIPGLSAIPSVGTILFRQDALVYLSYLLVPAMWFFIYRTRPGLHLRAIGEKPEAADAMGIDVARLRAAYVIAGGALAGLGGAAISVGTNPGWTDNMTAGRGWIAVALVIFAGWNPVRAAFGAYLFGGVEAGQFRLQGAGVGISAFFLNMLPYLFTIAVLILATRESTRRHIGAPDALGRPYLREERN